MPRGDRTGPLGEGPLTGRQLGYGAGFDSPGYTKGAGGRLGRGFGGRGAGFGRGYGRGFFIRGRNWRAAEPLEEQPESIMQLRSDIHGLQSQMDILMKKLHTLSGKEAGE